MIDIFALFIIFWVAWLIYGLCHRETEKINYLEFNLNLFICIMDPGACLDLRLRPNLPALTPMPFYMKYAANQRRILSVVKIVNFVRKARAKDQICLMAVI